MSRSPAEVIARAVHDNDRAYAPPYWDDCYPEMQRFYLEMGEAALAALAGEGWTLIRREEAFEVSCDLCDGGGELYGCAEDAPDICRSCEDGDLDHVIDCPRCDGNGDVMVVPLVPVEGENP